jgi:serine phosphatase RsbU (regulator of sigma subunit)
MVDAISGFTTRSLICAPILHRNELIGVVQVLNPVGKAAFDSEDLAALEYFADLAAVSIIRQKLLDDKIKQSRLSVEMEAAAEIQSRFRPEIPCLGCDTHAWGYSENASFVGGDLYDFISLDDGTFLAYLADVCGKGLPASLIMAALWSRMRSEAHLIKEPHLLLENVNKSLFDLLSGGLTLATAVVGRYHPDIGRLDFSLAGHPPPIRLGEGEAGTVPDAKGMPLGISETVTFERKSVFLQPGESVVFYSDGVTEAMNKKKDMFGVERLLAFAESIPTRPVGGILTEELRKWRGDDEPADDTTILEIWRETDPAP